MHVSRRERDHQVSAGGCPKKNLISWKAPANTLWKEHLLKNLPSPKGCPKASHPGRWQLPERNIFLGQPPGDIPSAVLVERQWERAAGDVSGMVQGTAPEQGWQWERAALNFLRHLTSWLNPSLNLIGVGWYCTTLLLLYSKVRGQLSWVKNLPSLNFQRSLVSVPSKNLTSP